MFVVETNVLVYAADEDSPYHKECRSLLEDWRLNAHRWYVTWPIVYEFLRVVTHRRVFRSPWPLDRAWQFIEALLVAPGLAILAPGERHAEVVAELFRALPQLNGNVLHDSHTAVLMREHGVRRIYTRDTDFHRFTFLEVADPLR